MERRKHKALLDKIEEWQKKARQEIDPFNGYLSFFIAYNIFYNLYEKTKHPNSDLAGNDSRKAIATQELVSNSDDLFQALKPKLIQYLKIIPVFREEYWPSDNSPQKVKISEALTDAVEKNDSKMAIEMLLKWLYKVRCNLVHGEKRFNDRQQKQLLAESNSIMGIILQHLVKSYQDKYS